MASAKVVADSLEQSCTIGDTHHAIDQGLMRKEDVYAELSEIVAGRKPGRTSDDEIIVFDSTGVAIEDAVAAVAVYESGAPTKPPRRVSISPPEARAANELSPSLGFESSAGAQSPPFGSSRKFPPDREWTPMGANQDQNFSASARCVRPCADGRPAVRAGDVLLRWPMRPSFFVHLFSRWRALSSRRRRL